MLLFLDLDGVVTTPDSRRRSPHGTQRGSIHRPCVAQLDRVLAAVPSMRVVITSVWRKWRSLDEIRSYLALADPSRVIDQTPVSKHGRGQEIRDWLSVHPTADWLVLDDTTHDLTPVQRQRTILCLPSYGLTRVQADALIARATAMTAT